MITPSTSCFSADAFNSMSGIMHDMGAVNWCYQQLPSAGCNDNCGIIRCVHLRVNTPWHFPETSRTGEAFLGFRNRIRSNTGILYLDFPPIKVFSKFPSRFQDSRDPAMLSTGGAQEKAF